MTKMTENRRLKFMGRISVEPTFSVLCNACIGNLSSHPITFSMCKCVCIHVSYYVFNDFLVLFVYFSCVFCILCMFICLFFCAFLLQIVRNKL